MNKFGRNFAIRARSNGRRDFFEHDDRCSSSEASAFRNQGRYKGGSGQAADRALGSWVDHTRRNRGDFTWKRKGRNDGRTYNERDKLSYHKQLHERGRGGQRFRGGRGPYMHQTIRKSGNEWFKIIIKNGSHYNKDEVLSSIRSLVEEPFVPVLYEIEGANLVFYIEDNINAVGAIKDLNLRLTMSDGDKINLSFTQCAPPVRKLSETQTPLVKKLMSERYSPELQRLDLSNFHNDSALVQANVFAPLYRSAIMESIVQIILTNIPGVKEIDFSKNKLVSLEYLKPLSSCASLVRLNLSKNKLVNMEELKKLQQLNIQELILEGNPVCNTFKDADIYISCMRKIFPKLINLDGVELPKPIGFEVEDEPSNLPASKGSFFCNAEVVPIVRQFIEQYYQVYESGDRRPLEAAYTDDALFSMLAVFPETGPGSKLTIFFVRRSRNLKVTKSGDRHKNLVSGKTKIVDLLCGLPDCRHDPASFVITVPVVKPQLMLVILSGVFSQLASPTSPLRYFRRTLIIVPIGGGFCIANEQFYVTSASVDQVKVAFKSPPQLPASVSSPGPSSAVAQPVAQDVLAGLQPVQIEMIKQFAVHSKMLPKYCRECLENSNWEFEKAGQLFLTLKQEGKIPADYFESSAAS